MDTQDQELQVRAPGRKQRRRTIQERREIVEETLVAGTSVSRVARRHDVNANQVFYWRNNCFTLAVSAIQKPTWREASVGNSEDSVE